MRWVLKIGIVFYALTASFAEAATDCTSIVSILFYPKHPDGVPSTHTKLRVSDTVVSNDRGPGSFEGFVHLAEKFPPTHSFQEIRFTLPQAIGRKALEHFLCRGRGVACSSIIQHSLRDAGAWSVPRPISFSPYFTYLYLIGLHKMGRLNAEIHTWGRPARFGITWHTFVEWGITSIPWPLFLLASSGYYGAAVPASLIPVYILLRETGVISRKPMMTLEEFKLRFGEEQ